MDIRELLHKRVLVKVKGQRYQADSVEEVKVLEVSPSGNWTKLQNLNGFKYWKPTTDVALVETLTELTGSAEPRPID